MTKTKTLIIGSGPAGLTAAIYAARSALEPILICGMQPGGQLTITTDVENYPGFAKAISGPWLMQEMEAQAKNVGASIIYDYVQKVDFTAKPFKVSASSGDVYLADSVIISTGAQARWLGLPSEKEFQGFGVSGCATCDGFFFKGQEVVVVGGGNTAVEEALYLTNHASKVYLVHRRGELRAEKIMQNRLFENPKIVPIWNHVVKEIVGVQNPKAVTGVLLQNVNSEEVQKIACEGVFVAIGHKPNTDIFKGMIEMDQEGYIITSPGSTRTNIDGVFAAGDVQDKIYRQAVTAAGSGCMAAIDADKYLRGL